MKYLLAVMFLSLAAVAQAELSAVEKLSPETRQLLQQEMVAVEQGMKDILSANLAGDTVKVAAIARRIKESFILKQGLSKKQMHELHKVLPADFLQRDHQFHYYAGMLSHVAENDKTELISFYYGKLFESCSGCHQEHAKFRFSNFISKIKTNDHDH